MITISSAVLVIQVDLGFGGLAIQRRCSFSRKHGSASSLVLHTPQQYLVFVDGITRWRLIDGSWLPGTVNGLAGNIAGWKLVEVETRRKTPEAQEG